MASKHYFELSEFIKSETAEKKGIDNTPTFEVVEHLRELRDTLLDDLREAWGGPLIVTSGFRCKALNKAVGGSPTSDHPYGYVADLQPKDKRRTAKFVLWAACWIKDSGKRYDQVIDERVNGERWLHVSIRHADGSQRMQNFVIDV